MHEKLSEALDHISDSHIAEAAAVKKKSRLPWIGAAAAVLAAVILAGALIPGGVPGSNEQAGGTGPTDAPSLSQLDFLVSEAEYPQMSPYPDEMSFVNPVTGEFDDEGFDLVYTAWRQDLMRQRNQPEGYADSLDTYFARSIPALLAAAQEDNGVCSPLNIYMALAMLAETTDGESRQQILSLLNAGSLESLRTQAGQVWNAHYCADGASATVLANSLWLNEGLVYNTDTVNTLARDYYACVYQGNLGSPEMNTALRDWLNRQTGGLLQEQIQTVEMDPQTALALASTVYYRAKWTSEFYEGSNTEGAFHSPGGDTDVTYMHKTLSYGPYYWGEDFAAAYLGLEDGSRMWLILPDEGLTPQDILASGNAMGLVLDSGDYANQKSIKVNLSLPKFDVDANLRLEQTLQSLGITDVFSREKADMSPILPGQECWVDSVSHAARVAIDEEGVTAAAYTVMMMPGAAMPPEDEVDLVLDRPFLFVITSRDGLPLFAGVVNRP